MQPVTFCNRVDWTLTARQVLGLRRREKLPTFGIDKHFAFGLTFFLKPQGPRPIGTRRGAKKHRLFIICSCGYHCPAGRLSQHIKSTFHSKEL